MEIIWSLNARETFYNDPNYLEEYWGNSVANNFEIETFKVLDLLANNPKIRRYDDYFECTIILVVKQINLFCNIINNKIVLLTFWDNRQKPIKRATF